MLNGDGLRTVLWVAGCSHHCPECQNPITWDANGGILFDEAAKQELFAELEKDYVAGITFSGGDPLNEANVERDQRKIPQQNHVDLFRIYLGAGNVSYYYR